MTLVEAIQAVFRSAEGPLHVQDLYAALPDALEHSLRARIYENRGKFKRVGKGLYVAADAGAACIVVEGNAWQEIKKLPSGLADSFITDPPYAWLNEVLKIHTTTRPRMRWNFERCEIDRELGLEIYRVLKSGAHAFFFVPAETATTRPHIERFIRLLESCGLVFNKRWVWNKTVLGMGYNGRAMHEGILFMSKGRRRKPCDLSVPDVISCKPIDSRVRKHGCEKPRPLLEALIKFSTKAGELVLDCFAGTCSTGLAALGLGRDAVCIEKDAGALARALPFASEGTV